MGTRNIMNFIYFDNASSFLSLLDVKGFGLSEKQKNQIVNHNIFQTKQLGDLNLEYVIDDQLFLFEKKNRKLNEFNGLLDVHSPCNDNIVSFQFNFYKGWLKSINCLNVKQVEIDFESINQKQTNLTASLKKKQKDSISRIKSEALEKVNNLEQEYKIRYIKYKEQIDAEYKEKNKSSNLLWKEKYMEISNDQKIRDKKIRDEFDKRIDIELNFLNSKNEQKMEEYKAQQLIEFNKKLAYEFEELAKYMGILNLNEFKQPMPIGVRLPEIEVERKIYQQLDIDPKSSNFDLLRALCLRGVKQRGIDKLDNKQEYYDRVKMELSVLQELGFIDYILLNWDILNFCHENDIPTGPGRGSAAGSLVLFLLKVTNIDPIKYDLFFERFVSKSRAKKTVVDDITYLDGSLLADVDNDISYDRRAEVIKYIEEKHKGKTCKILTLNTLSSKLCVKECGKIVGGFSEEEVNDISASIPKQFGKVFKLQKAYDESEKLKKFCDDNPKYLTLPKTRRIKQEYWRSPIWDCY